MELAQLVHGLLRIPLVSAYASSVEVHVSKTFRHSHGLRMTLEREFPDVRVEMATKDVPRAVAHQVIRVPPQLIAEVTLNAADPRLGENDFLRAQIQQVIDEFCKLYLPRLEQ